MINQEAGKEAGKPREERVSRNKVTRKWLNCDVAIPLTHGEELNVLTKSKVHAWYLLNEPSNFIHSPHTN